MRREEQTQVLVAGAGPVGLLTALLLAENGVQLRVIDMESQTAGPGCACALHPHSLTLLDQAGVADDVIKLGQRVDVIRFYEGRSCRAEVSLSELPVKFPFALILEQGDLEQLLEQRLQQFNYLHVDWNHRLAELDLNSQGAAVTVEKLARTGKGYVLPEFEWVVQKTNIVLADFVVVADGHDSLVRQRLNLRRERVGEPELFVMYELECARQLIHENEISVTLDENKLNALWPLSAVECRWAFQWLPADEPGNFPGKERSHFIVAETPGSRDGRHLERLLRARAPWFENGIKEVDQASDIQFDHWVVEKFGRDRCWLAGDAAHQTGPLGMQSLNAGLREAADLAARLKSILREQESLETLEAYDRRHRMEWRELLGLNSDPKPMAATNEWVKEHRAQILAGIPASGGDLFHLLRRLGLEFEPAAQVASV